MLENAYDFFLSKELAIDPLFGISKLAEYQHKLGLIGQGVNIKEVFERKDFLNIETLSYSNAGTISSQSIEVDPYNVSDCLVKIQNNSVAIIDLSGFMSVEDGLCSYGALSYAKLINQLSMVDSIIGLIIECNSGGGETMAGHIWYDSIKDFRKKNKSAIGHVLMAGSAAYNAMCACNEIIGKNKASSFGSIGTFFSASKKNIEFIRDNIIELYSRLSEEKNLNIRELMKGNPEVILDEADELASIFHETVKENRPLKGDVENTLKGNMFRYEEARQRGLVDSIGNRDYVLSRIKAYKYNI